MSSRRDEPIPWIEGEDEPDYVVLPPDPEVIENERQRAAEDIAHWEAEAKRQPQWVGVEKSRDFKIQYSLKDLFALTTILAASLAAGLSMGGLGTFLLFFALGSVSWIHIRLLIAERAAERAAAIERGETPDQDVMWWPDLTREVFRYSVADILIAITVMAFVFALFRWLEKPTYVAGVLSLWVFGWVALFFFGARPSRKWWLIWVVVTIAYIAFTIAAVVQK